MDMKSQLNRTLKMRQTSIEKKEFYQNDEVVAYSADMKPLTKKQYIKEIEDAIAEVDRGEFITDEDLTKEMLMW